MLLLFTARRGQLAACPTGFIENQALWVVNPVFLGMEVSSVFVAGSERSISADKQLGWWARLRILLGAANWPATSESGRIPLWIHGLLWLWLLGLDTLKASNAVARLPHFPVGPAEWQPLLATLGRLLLEDVGSATLFYLTWRWLVPRTLGRGRVVEYVALAAVLVLPYAGLVGWVMPQVFNDKIRIATAKTTAFTTKSKKPVTIVVHGKKMPVTEPREWLQLFGASIVGTLIVGSSSALRITGDYLRGQRNRREMERQQLLIELAMLKTQINPHFLFNTLNNIYSLTSRKSDKAPEAVLRLSEIMRYLLYESSTDTVPLSRELAHLRSFLDLQRLRLSATAQDAIQLTVTGAPADCAHPIAPLLLLPLVENAFKHGDLAARPVAVQITLELASDGQLRFSVLNHVAPADAERELPNQPGGVGLVNLRRRLALLYPGRHTLQVQTPLNQHLVTLVLG
ncbi:sensor histidine kinase [Hymenobacter norwichensis]|uniref:sensor histidine kinase n=1 Tax=Hymenobacter norwichensis TaxID=223903 RepID=UPI0003B6596A|nr:sensor histidine kinase [Hymenobacter norwichensis]